MRALLCRHAHLCAFLALVSACGTGSAHGGSSSSGQASSAATGAGTTSATSSGATSAHSTSGSVASTSSSSTHSSSVGSLGSSGHSSTSGASIGSTTTGGSSSGGSSGVTDAGPLEITGTSPLPDAIDVWTSPAISATFSQALDPTTLNATTFFLVQSADGGPDGGQQFVPGSVFSDAGSNAALFVPSAPLGAGLLYTATLTAGVTSATGLPRATPYSWSFTTGTCTAPSAVNLGAAANFVILAETGISTVPASAITGNIGVSPAAATYITMFSPTLDASGVFSTSTQVTGEIFASDYAPPTPSNLTTAVNDMDTAFTDAAGRPACVTELGAGNIGGLTLGPGVYSWGTGLLIPTDLSLAGSATDVWIFQVAQDLTLSSGVSVFLQGGALAKNVFWQVSGQTTMNTTAHLEGIVLCQTQIALATGPSVNCLLLAQSAVTLQTSTVVQPQ